MAGRRSASANNRPRLEDVAALAGVSLGSASKAMSAPDSVRPKTREKVLNAASELGYVPHGAARALARRCSMLVGVVLPTINNPIYAEFAHALQRRLRQHSYQLMVAAHEYNVETEHAITEQLLQTGVDGLILVGSDHPLTLIHRVRESEIPFLCAWSTDEECDFASVGISNRRAMDKIMRHLLELGHRRFAVIAGSSSYNERTRLRVSAIERHLKKYAVTPSVHYCGFTIDDGRKSMKQILAMSQRPTAVVCTTDLLAAGALEEARMQNIAVPGELSITGFDDVEFAALLSPPLTTVRVATDRIGDESGSMIVELMSGHTLEHYRIDIPTRLMKRQSTGPSNTKKRN